MWNAAIYIEYNTAYGNAAYRYYVMVTFKVLKIDDIWLSLTFRNDSLKVRQPCKYPNEREVTLDG